MTREKAFTLLNLSPSATREEIEQAYQRLVRRYPPEFHPEKFRELDEAYRFLTSLAYRIESILSPRAAKGLDRDVFSFALSPPVDALEEALSEIEREMKLAHLWKPLRNGAL